MKLICVDDEKIMLDGIRINCSSIPEVEEVIGFQRAKDALDFVKEEKVDVALLDIDMPEMNGLELARLIKTESPETYIIFTTGYSEYAVEAFRQKASGYLLKPVEKEDIEKELRFIIEQGEKKKKKSIYVQTFGNFEVFVDNSLVHFKRSKAKEVLAYLVDKNGTGVTRSEIAAILWEDEEYDRSHQKQLDVYLRAMKDDLKEYCADKMLDLSTGLRVIPDNFECDMYLFLNGDVQVINHYCGEYMNQYSWAEFTAASLSNLYDKMQK